ncbi:MAG TPA: hypothetical protein EYP86_03445, partial [Candidatus Altiarchaeales archaeon]|nr:hypothetical protein [Candidatus Altiarchaeales archaeon]
MKNSENLKKKYEKYLIRGETPLREYEIGAYSVVTIDQRLLCIRKFPESFTQITYDSISNIEYHIYIDWRRF